MILWVKIDTEKPLLIQVKKQLPKPKYFIKKEDVGCGSIAGRIINGIMDYPFVSLGKVLKNDVGKMCLKKDKHWYVENEEQFAERKNK